MSNAVSILEDRLISEKEYERLRGLAPGTGAVQRCRGTNPVPYVRIGRQIRYRLSSIESLIERNTIAPKSVVA